MQKNSEKKSFHTLQEHIICHVWTMTARYVSVNGNLILEK